MKIDLHIHTKTGSDGNLSLEEVFQEAKNRDIGLISITDHDSIDCQEKAILLANELGISYVTGVELNITFQYPGSKSISLDFLGYQFDPENQGLKSKLEIIRDHREIVEKGRILCKPCTRSSYFIKAREVTWPDMNWKPDASMN